MGRPSEGVVKQSCRAGSRLVDQMGLLNGPVVDQGFPEVVKMDVVGMVGETQLLGQEVRGSLGGASQTDDVLTTVDSAQLC